mgnify:CR=1 FL=1
MRSNIVADKTQAQVAAAERLGSGGWNGPHIGIARKSPRPGRAEQHDELAAARGIGVALIAGACIWVGVVWGAASLLARFV